MTRVLADDVWRNQAATRRLIDDALSLRKRFRRAVTLATRWVLRRQDGGAR